MVIENITIKGLIDTMLILIPTGVILRLTICGIRIMAGDEDETPKEKKRAKNALAFMIISESVLTIVKLVNGYFI